MNQAEIAEIVADRRPLHGRAEGPLVSMVVVTRNGAHHLRRLLAGLRDRTNYRNFEVIVVDNGSSDDSNEVLAQDWNVPITVIRNETNSTFSRANNQGIETARGDLVLILNNDVDPINPSWLGCMVDTLLTTPDIAAVGPLLIYPERQIHNDTPPAHPDLSVQHAGLFFDWQKTRLRAGNLGVGTDPLRPDASAVRRRPGVTAACLLTWKSYLDAVEGFTEGYIYGSEDWDLCLMLHEFGDIAVVGAAALFHHEYGTQKEITASITEVNRRDNWQRFVESWGPRLSRELRLDRIQKQGSWNPDRSSVLAIAVDPKQDLFGTHLALAEALERRGWSTRIITLDKGGNRSETEDIDVLVTTTPKINLANFAPHTFKVAWVIDDEEAWADPELLDDYRLVAVSNPLLTTRFESITGIAPLVLLPAADESMAESAIDPVYETDILVDSNAKNSNAKLPKTVTVAPDERLVVFGSGWDLEPRFARYWRGTMDDDQHAALLANAKIVVHSQRADRSWLGSRGILNTLASGALPVTDSFEVSQWMFDGRLPVATSSRRFRSIADRYLDDEQARRSLVRELMSIVEARHTFPYRAAELDDAVAALAKRPTISIKISPHNREVARRWGDTHFARQFGKALRRQGFYTFSDILPQWDLPSRQEADIVIHLRGLDPYVPKAGSFNVLWIVSHPADITPQECNRFDLVLVASTSFAEKLKDVVDVPVYPLLQATDASVFYPDETRSDLRSELLFVGNARWPARIAPRWAMELGFPITIYGANWDRFPEKAHVVAPYFPNERLAELYSAADIVLNDHWPDMKQEGFIANRLFDVLAAGGFVISDHVEGIEAAFDGAVPTYRSKDELGDLVQYYRDHPEERAQLAIRGMRKVRDSHTFDARARQFLDYLGSLTPELPLDVSGQLIARLDELPVRSEYRADHAT